MARDKHPDKEIEVALQYVESKNWRVEKSKAKGIAHMPGGGYIARLRVIPALVAKGALQAFGVHHEAQLIMLSN